MKSLIFLWFSLAFVCFSENYDLKNEIGWESTSIVINHGDIVSIKCGDGSRDIQQSGMPSFRDSNGIKSRTGNLIGKIDGCIFDVGDEVRITSSCSGVLELRRNFSQSPNGTSSVQISIGDKKEIVIPIPNKNSSESGKLNYLIGEFFKNLDSAIEKDKERWNNKIIDISYKISQNEQKNENEMRRQKVIDGKRGSIGGKTNSGAGFGGENFHGQKNSIDSSSLYANLKNAKETLGIYQMISESSKKNRSDAIDYYKLNIDRTDDKNEVPRRILGGMYSFYNSVVGLCKNVESTSLSVLVMNNFLKNVESMEWFKKSTKSSENNGIPQNEEEFISKFGHKVRHETKFISKYGTSNTYWIENTAINYDDGKLSSIYQSN